jgi:hypothetical protein
MRQRHVLNSCLVDYRLCREILNSCIRNTEAAEDTIRKNNDPQDSGVNGRGLGKGVWGMIEESVLARSLREKDGREVWFICLASYFGSEHFC